MEIPHSGIVPGKPPDISHRIEILDNINYKSIIKYLDEKALFGRGWGIYGRNAAKFRKDHYKILEKMKKLSHEIVEPRAIYGHFKCVSNGEILTIHNNDISLDFAFPRWRNPPHISISDYFSKNDIVSLQAVTLGNNVSKTITDLAESKPTDAFYLNGFLTEFVESLAEYTTIYINKEIKRTCLRYSWGYPDCPDISQHKLVWELLKPERIGMKLTPSSQISPDLSTGCCPGASS